MNKKLPELKPTSAATIQLSVPVIAALGGILILKEPLTIKFIGASLVTLCGFFLTNHGKKRVPEICCTF